MLNDPRFRICLLALFLALWVDTALAVGRKTASAFFSNRTARQSGNSDYSTAPHLISFYLGFPLKYSDKAEAHFLHSPSILDISHMGLTYRIGQWVNLMDLSLKIERYKYTFIEKTDFSRGGKPGAPPPVSDPQDMRKVSIMPIITFPEAASNFPIYGGVGVGVGYLSAKDKNFEFKNFKDQLTLDYQIFAGVRVFDLHGNWGVFGEVSLNNQVSRLSRQPSEINYFSVGTMARF